MFLLFMFVHFSGTRFYVLFYFFTFLFHFILCLSHADGSADFGEISGGFVGGRPRAHNGGS